MNKFTTVAVIAALALATQAFALSGNTKGGQTKSMPTMKTGSSMKTGTPAMTSTTPMNGVGTMTSTMSATGAAKQQMTTKTPMQPAAAK